MMGRRKNFTGATISFIAWTTGTVAVLSTLALLYNMFAIWWFADQFFVEKALDLTLDLNSKLVMGGFISILLLNILAIIWVILDGYYFRKYTAFDYMLIMFGVACIILMYGEKTMIDELGREHPIGWDTTGEWVILYILLFIQLVYNTLILLRRYAPERMGYVAEA